LNFGEMQIKSFWFLFLVSLILMVSQKTFAEDYKVKITEPKNRAKVKNPFKICMDVKGLVVEPADKKRNEGKGHHHILFSSLPADLNKPLRRKDALHLSKGQTCVMLKMQRGKHVITSLFSYGDHVPYNPPIMDKILITIK
jgi:hypothetical protein